MTSENKYTMYIKLALDEKMNGPIISTIIENALLLYTEKTGQKMTVAQMAVYEDFLQDTPIPIYEHNHQTVGDRIRSMTDEELANDLLVMFEEICESGLPCKEWMLDFIRGRWVDKEDYYTEIGFTCSVCGERYWLEDYETLYNYCPNCGSKMDLK